MAKRKFLDIIGLETYDEKIKAYIDGEIDSIPSDTMIVNVTLDGTTYSADKTGAEIKAAIDAGKFVCAVYNNEIYYVTNYKSTNIHFQYQKVDLTGVTSKLLSCVISSDRWAYDDGNFTYADIANVKTNSTLTTESKTIVGAINELDSEMSSHNHDDIYYTEEEIDQKLSAVNTNITNITSGSTPVKEAEHATSADTATNATNANHASSADTATTATSATKATQDGNGKVIANTYETKTDAQTKLNEAKSYADTAATTVKNDLLNGAGAAYDTLKELGALIDENSDAIDALETVAAGKADKEHNHDDRYYTEEEIDAMMTAITIAEIDAICTMDDVEALVKAEYLAEATDSEGNILTDNEDNTYVF